jgi:hypothetical protein
MVQRVVLYQYYLEVVVKRLHSVFLLMCGLLMAGGANAAVQRVNFTMTGNNGEAATGYITYNDAVVGNGQAISGGGICGGGPDNSINYEINVTGGTVGPLTFNKANCAIKPAFCNVPNFTLDVNFFSCTSLVGGATGNGYAPNTFRITSGANISDLTFTSISPPTPDVPPAPPQPIPTLSEWAQIMMMLMMIATAGFYGWRMKQR